MASTKITLQNTTPPKINKTEQKILNYVKENFEVPPKDIVEFLEISAVATYKYLKNLVELCLLEKLGKSPKVFYRISNLKINDLSEFVEEFAKKYNTLNSSKKEFETLVTQLKQNLEVVESDYLLDLIDKSSPENVLKSAIKLSLEEEKDVVAGIISVVYILKDYINITAEGLIIGGLIAFIDWCNKRKLPLSKTLLSYINIQEKYKKFKTKDDQFIIATDKFKQTFGKDVQLDEVLYCDFYSIEVFGKTKLGSLLLHGKQTQNIKIINQVCFQVKDKILKYISENQIDAVAFIPPTIDRKPQFMDEFRKSLNLFVPVIKLEKVVNDIAIQQKTLKSSQERIENTRNTIFVDEKRTFKNILLLDDAVGSGSTFNEIARKLRLKKLVTGKISAIAIVGSANGIIDSSSKFEVLNEV